MTLAILSLGGNLGDPQAAMGKALRAMIPAGITVQKVSRLYRTPPWGPIEQPDFLNCCALIDTSLDSGDLLDFCLSVEEGLQRERKERWGPRLIDIDIVDMDGPPARRTDLQLPHPRASDRAFVLVPMTEITPERTLFGLRPAEWLGGLDVSEIVPVTVDGEWWREPFAQSSAV